MKHSIHCSILAACSLLLSSTVAVRPALGDILTGTYMLPPAGDSKFIPFSDGQFDANPITMGQCFPENLVANVTPYFIFNPFVMLTLDDLITPQFKVNCMGLGEAVFAFVSPLPSGTANVDFNNFPAPGGQFSAELNLIDDPTGLFGTFADALFIITFGGLLLDPTADGKATWPVPPTGRVNVRFQLISLGGPIPEPGSLALAVCGLMGLTGMAWLRRRQPKSL
jgi:hypothetical protein